MSPRFLVDIFQLLVDIAIVVVFIIEIIGARQDRVIHAKQIELLDGLNKLLSAKAEEETELLEDIHAELTDINEKQPEILNEGQQDDDLLHPG